MSFEPLWKQPEYSALLERVNLCDTVTIRHSLLGVSVSAMVIETVYDTLAERYKSISLGQSKSSMITTISAVQSSVDKVESTVGRFPKLLQTAIGKAIGLITGQSGGYVVIHTSEENGQPYELLILDAPSIDDAVNVWRWNVGGLGFSHNGYNGPYETAITADGQIVADFITSGSLVANIIKAGVIQSQDGSSYWDLETGEVVIRGYASSDAIESVTRDIEGLDTTVSNHSERLSEFQSSVDGLNSYVSGMTETMQTLESSVSGEQQKVLEMQQQVSELQHSVEGLSVSVQEQFAGGINYIKNSAGLNGVTDDWVTTGVVTTDNSTDVQSNTTSDSCFVLEDTSTLMQTITGVVPGAYTVSVRAKKTGADYTAYFRVQYSGNKYAYLFNTTETFGWTEYSAVIDDVQDGTIIVCSTGSAITVGKIAKSGSVTVTLSVTDSRGYTAETSQTVTVIPYTKPKISSITLRRTNDIEAEMQLKFSGSISAVTVNGTQKNSVVYVRYRYKKTSESSYGSYTSIYSGTTKSGTSFSYSNLELCSLDANTSYDFHLQIQDKLYSLSGLDLYFTVPQGTPLIALRKKKVGINTPEPQATLDVDGSIHMNGVNVHGKMGRVDGSTTDRNNVKTPGYYFAYSASTEKHFPTTTIGMLEVFLPESYFIQQRYTVYDGSRMYIRGNYGGTWSSWHTVSLTAVI